MRQHDDTAHEQFPAVDGLLITGLLGTGGFSRVYRATQRGLERDVAVKVLNSSFEDQRQQRVFERECKVMGRLSTHPNIVTVFNSAVTSDGRPSIVMELYAGTYREEGKLDIREVVDVGIKVAGALQEVHDLGIVHRDIKPHNIFISERGEPAIGDFGISSIEAERTVTGGAGFSINYAPPETFEDGATGAPGDIYALGATLYQLATGDVPFPHHGDPADRIRSTVHKIITVAPPTLNVAGTPPSLDRLLQKCMAKQPSGRPSSAAAVESELRRIQREIGPPDRRARTKRTAPPVSGDIRDSVESDVGGGTIKRGIVAPAVETSAPADDDRSPDGSRRGLVVGAVVALALIVISGIAIALSGGSDDPETSTTTTASTVDIVEFVALVPPSDVVVTRIDDTTYEIDWTVADSDIKYQVHEIGAAENRITDAPPLRWRSESAGSGCFEIRAVDADETRISQSASTPACG